MSKIKQFSRKTEDFNIDMYIELKKFNSMFDSFKNSINPDDDTGSDELRANQKKFFLKYTNNILPNINLKEIKNIEIKAVKNEIQKSNSKYAYLLANILIYAKNIYDLGLSANKEKIQKYILILNNIKQYVFNFEEASITGILFMNKGLNYIDYNKSFNIPSEEPIYYLFYDKFVKWYNNNLFKNHIKPIFEDFTNQEYRNKFKNSNDSSDFNIICNTIILDIIKKFIEELNKKTDDEPESKRQRTIGGKRILKKYLKK